MGRRKRNFVFSKKIPISKKASSGNYDAQQSVVSARGSNPELMRQSDKVLPITTTQAGISLSTSWAEKGRPRPRRRPERLKFSLQRICMVTAVANWVSSIITYIVTKHSFLPSELTLNAFKLALCGISAFQIFLIVSYWNLRVIYLEAIRRSLHPDYSPLTQLKNDPKLLLFCCCECVFHLLIPIPSLGFEVHLDIFNSESVLDQNDICLILVLLRNYHSLRAFYWFSRFSDLKTMFFAQLAQANYTVGLVLRGYLADFTLKLVVFVYGAMVIFSGLIVYLLERNSANCLSTLWNSFAVVAVTQTTVGYGDCTPESFLGQVALIISGFFGFFVLGLLNSMSGGTMTLSLRESSMYSELLYGRCKEDYVVEAIILVQRWWRLLKNRKKTKIDVRVIFGFYIQLRVYRHVLTKCQLVKDTLFERQIAAFERSIRTKLRSMSDYLYPAAYTHTIVCNK